MIYLGFIFINLTIISYFSKYSLNSFTTSLSSLVDNTKVNSDILSSIIFDPGK